MYQEHPAFAAPKDHDARIWRYVDLARFLSLLTTRALYFSRADRLGDPFEGSISKATLETYADPTSPTSLAGFQDSLRRLRESLRRNVAISCWHIAEDESTAMWSQYAGKGSGIALRSTYARLITSLAAWQTPTYIGCVNYVDYQSTPVGSGNNLLAPFVHKRHQFASECELRAVISQTPASAQGGVSVVDHSVSMPPGILAPVDVAGLVDRVVLSPQTPDWQIDAIKDIIAALGHTLPLERSALDGEAILG
jgi:hypothetical protein